MYMLRRPWLLVSGATFGCIAVALVVSAVWPSQRAHAEPGATAALAPSAATAVEQLRQRTGVSDEAIAAMGLNQTAAQELLSAVLGWYESNKAALDRLKEAERIGTAQMAASSAKISAGKGDAATVRSYSDAQAAASASIKEQAELVKGLDSAIAARLSDDQKAILKASRDNAGAPSPYRYLRGATAEQAKAVRAAYERWSVACAEAGTAQARQTANEKLRDDVARTLGASLVDEAASIRARIAEKMPGVLAAKQSVLAVAGAVTTEPGLSE